MIASVKKIKRLRRGKTTACLRAEATRRLGDADEAEAILASRTVKLAEGNEVDSVKARIRADLGDLWA